MKRVDIARLALSGMLVLCWTGQSAMGMTAYLKKWTKKDDRLVADALRRNIDIDNDIKWLSTDYAKNQLQSSLYYQGYVLQPINNANINTLSDQERSACHGLIQLIHEARQNQTLMDNQDDLNEFSFSPNMKAYFIRRVEEKKKLQEEKETGLQKEAAKYKVDVKKEIDLLDSDYAKEQIKASRQNNPSSYWEPLKSIATLANEKDYTLLHEDACKPFIWLIQAARQNQTLMDNQDSLKAFSFSPTMKTYFIRRVKEKKELQEEAAKYKVNVEKEIDLLNSNFARGRMQASETYWKPLKNIATLANEKDYTLLHEDTYKPFIWLMREARQSATLRPYQRNENGLIELSADLYNWLKKMVLDKKLEHYATYPSIDLTKDASLIDEDWFKGQIEKSYEDKYQKALQDIAKCANDQDLSNVSINNLKSILDLMSSQKQFINKQANQEALKKKVPGLDDEQIDRIRAMLISNSSDLYSQFDGKVVLSDSDLTKIAKMTHTLQQAYGADLHIIIIPPGLTWITTSTSVAQAVVLNKAMVPLLAKISGRFTKEHPWTSEQTAWLASEIKDFIELKAIDSIKLTTLPEAQVRAKAMGGRLKIATWQFEKGLTDQGIPIYIECTFVGTYDANNKKIAHHFVSAQSDADNALFVIKKLLEEPSAALEKRPRDPEHATTKFREETLSVMAGEEITVKVEKTPLSKYLNS